MPLIHAAADTALGLRLSVGVGGPEGELGGEKLLEDPVSLSDAQLLDLERSFCSRELASSLMVSAIGNERGGV
jgi:hypothetical protein